MTFGSVGRQKPGSQALYRLLERIRFAQIGPNLLGIEPRLNHGESWHLGARGTPVAEWRPRAPLVSKRASERASPELPVLVQPDNLKITPASGTERPSAEARCTAALSAALLRKQSSSYSSAAGAITPFPVRPLYTGAPANTAGEQTPRFSRLSRWGPKPACRAKPIGADGYLRMERRFRRAVRSDRIIALPFKRNHAAE